jgi:2-oxoglutarate dehydrogenase E2 component (dihydrolipoamide succinyltransferase)
MPNRIDPRHGARIDLVVTADDFGADEAVNEAVERARRAFRDQFKAEEGFSLTYLPFISRAVVDALHEFPHMNASMGDGEVLLHSDVNLSIAVDLDFQGLLAPVVRNAQSKRLRAIARDVRDLADRARARNLGPDDLAGGTFTISNSGNFGTLMVAAVINQPQVAILATGAIKKKPVVIESEKGDSIAIRHMMFVSMSYDHRIIDGGMGSLFLAAFVEALESFDVNRTY